MTDTFIYCDICGEPIYGDETRYEMPDGKTVCGAGDCLAEWAGEYERSGTWW